MKHENLSGLLTNLVEALGILLDALKLQQHALVKNNREVLDESIKLEEAASSQVNQVQNRIIVEIKEINEKENLELKELKLSELIAALEGKNSADVKTLTALRMYIVNNITEISRVNFQNSFLIDNSRQMIKDIITTAASAKNALFDRRV